ncbi:class I SAM-dependent methyltransferase [Brevibacillus marinus]|uniref:class I SAM-dependent methyltransferase n=1 Tax=Brevibacillus marinus TaxID=2496837 RepID=UPI000F8368C5|nr:methyltransferase domain-containing protein [Brevibacillus marinus]
MAENIKDKVKEQFSKNAEKYVTSVSHATGSDLAKLVEWLQPLPNWKVLDVATGGGHVAKTLSPHVEQIFSTDLTREMLAAARNHLSASCRNVFYVVADAEALPFLDEVFDVVTCRIAAHHFPHPDQFVREVSRVLKPGGKFVLIDNIAPEDKRLDQFINTLEKLRDQSHGRCYSLAEWRQWFADSGLEIRNSEVRKKTYDFPVWVRRTTESEEQVQSVVEHIRGADPAALDYFAVEQAEGEIRSLQIDEWMVLAEKAAN